ncbi:MAG: serine/threonine protein kinase [Myxococcaceae bacterium]|nr:serine/threonine protein kinase [Myxococcaceae bacterium]
MAAKPAKPAKLAPIDRYTVLRPLGKGGMAEVFLVAITLRDGTTAGRFALKRVLPEHGGEDEFTQSFRDEALLLAKLEHPYIVHAYDLGSHDGHSFLVMELVDGVDLRKLLKFLSAQNRSLPPQVAVHIAMCVCTALDYVASEPFGIIHRDVSPHNVLLGLHGQVKLTDFGIARSKLHEHRTATNVMKGKAAYMSPEQIDEQLGLDHRSDLYALGIVLYEMLSGVNPFKGVRRTEQQITYAIRHVGTFRALNELAPDLHPGLVSLVHQLLAHDKEERPANAQLVIRMLEQLIFDGSAPRALAELVAEAQGHYLAMPTSGTASRSILEPDHQANPPTGFVATKGLHAFEEDDELLEESGELDLAHVAIESTTGAPQDFTTGEHAATTRKTPVPRAVGAAPLPDSRPTTAPPGRARSRTIAAALTVGTAALLLVLVRGTPAAPPHPQPSPAPAAPRATAATQATAMPTPHAAPAVPADLPPPPSETENPTPIRVPEALAVSTSSADATTPPAPSARNTQADTQHPKELATLRLLIEPWGNVWLDDKFYGLAEHDLKGLRPGLHKLQIGQDVPSQTLSIRLKPGLNTFSYKLH